MRANKIYTWKSDVNHCLSDISKAQGEYDVHDNACAVAELFASGLPSNTLDVLYGAIAKRIRVCINSHPEGLNEKHYIEFIIRLVMDDLAYEEKDKIQ